MNIKLITIAIIFFISSNVMGAIYEFQDEQQGPSSFQDLTSPLDSSFLNMEFPNQQALSANIKQEYIEIFKLLEKNQLENAGNKINALIIRSPKESELYNFRALLEIMKKNNNLAIKSYQKAIELNSDNFIAHLGLAKLYLQADNLDKAKEHSNISLSIDESVNAYFLLADIAYKKNNQQLSENILLDVLKKTQEKINLQIVIANKLAKLYMEQKQPGKILTLADDISNRYPENSPALSFLARAQILNGKNTQAVQTLEKLVNQEKKDTYHRLLLVSLLINQPKKEKQAIKLLDEVTSISPSNVQILTQKTVFLTKMKRFKEGFISANKIKKLAPDTGLAELLEGDIYLAEKKLNQALTIYQKSFKLQPNTKALNQITNIMIVQGKQADAINFLSKELIKNPKNLTAHFRLASIYEQQKNSSETEKHYLAILSEQPDNALVLNNLAWLYQQQNNPKALPLAEKAYQKAPKSAMFADTYSVILVKQGDLERGIQVLETASKLAPETYDIQYHLANAYVLNGDSKQAQKILNTILKSDHNFSEKNAALSLSKKLEKN